MFWVPNISAMALAWVVQCIILAGYVWFDKFRVPDQTYTCWLIRGMRGFIFIVFTVLSLVFIDTNIKILIFGIIGYSNIALHLASIILTFIITAEILIGVIIVAPNRKGLITFAVVLIIFIYLWEFYFPEANLSEIELFGIDGPALIFGILLPIFVGSIVALILTSIEIILKKVKAESRISDKPFWNKQVKAKKIFNFRFNLILWVLITTELILNLQGMSLLLWLTIFI